LIGIALTGYGMLEDMQRSRDAGFTTHLTKPVSIAALDKALAVLTAARV
jgi:CheY-like chemotaxis protein